MEFTKNTGVGGKWLDKKELVNGDILKIKTEAIEMINPQGGNQIVAKCQVKNKFEKEQLNVAINSPSKNALIDAFGSNSESWIDQLLTVEVEKVSVAGKRGIALYLIPDGYGLTEDSGGYIVIIKVGKTPEEAYEELGESDIKPEDIPF